VALGFAVLTAPEVVRAQRDWRDGVGVVVVVDRPRKAIKVIPAAGATKTSSTRSLPWRRRAMSALAYSTQASRS